MKDRIHTIITLVIQTFLHSLYMGFLLLAGPLCAIASGIIEYQVVVGLLPKTFWLIPVMIVLPFEIAKLFFIFWYPQMTAENQYSPRRKRVFAWIRRVLIVFSAMATMLFSFYNLYDPAYEEELLKKTEQLEESYKQQIAQVKKNYVEDVKQVEATCQTDKDEITARYKPQIDEWLAKMEKEEKYRDKEGNFNGKRYQAFKKNHDDAIEQRRIEIEQLNCSIEKLQERRKEEIAALYAQRDTQLNATEAQLHGSPKAGNPYLVATINVVGQVKEDTPFPYGAYIGSIFLLTLLITTGMEGIIYASLTTLSMQYGSAFMAQFQLKAMEEEYKAAQETVKRFNEIERKAFQEEVMRKKEAFDDTLKKMTDSDPDRSPPNTEKT